MSIWAIMSKVRIESFCWGVGTALGELPPYFMARAHRLSGYDPDDDEEDEFLELQQKDPNTLVICLTYFSAFKPHSLEHTFKVHVSEFLPHNILEPI